VAVRRLVLSMTLLFATSGRAEIVLLLDAPASGRVPPGALIDVAVVRVENDVLQPVGAVTFSEAIANEASDPYILTARARAPTSGSLTIVAKSGRDEAKASLTVDDTALGTLSVRAR
jgi:hypothetical protein